MSYIHRLLVVLSIIFISCSDNSEQETDLLLSTTDLTFPQGGGSQVLLIQGGTDWSLTGVTDWCTASEVSGVGGKTFRVTITATENQTPDQRAATLTVVSGTVTKTVKVTQALTLLAAKSSYTALPAGGTITVELKSKGEPSVRIGEGWISRSVTDQTRAVSSRAEVFSVEANYTGVKRTGTLIFTLDDVEEAVTIDQEPIAVPAPDRTGVESDATALAAKIKLGWNLGNSLEAVGGETAWGNPLTTQAIINLVKDAGFDAIRIPCNWSSGYLWDDVSHTIKASWLNRVKTVVDYCVNNGMVAILNIHYDGGWLEVNPTYAKQKEVNEKQHALWTQIAAFFRDYDEHLLFAGTNEVHVEGIYDNKLVTEENHTVQQSFNQTFVNAVRATGGRNAYRNLIVQAYNTNIELTAKLKMPTDQLPNRLMMEVHYYDPWEFAGSTTNAYWGEPYKDFGVTAWGGQESYADAKFASLKSNFVDKGIPVILGEYGANRHSMTNENMINSRAYYLEYITRVAKNNGAVPFYWDNGGMGNGDTADQFGIFDRKNLRIFDQPAVDALVRGAAKGAYPFIR